MRRGKSGKNVKKRYRRPPEFTVTQPERNLAGGLQSGHTVNLTGVRYIFRRRKYVKEAWKGMEKG